jgi:hypothetical protein
MIGFEMIHLNIASKHRYTRGGGGGGLKWTLQTKLVKNVIKPEKGVHS